jgi:hypothetical protein
MEFPITDPLEIIIFPAILLHVHEACSIMTSWHDLHHVGPEGQADRDQVEGGWNGHKRVTILLRNDHIFQTEMLKLN